MSEEIKIQYGFSLTQMPKVSIAVEKWIEANPDRALWGAAISAWQRGAAIDYENFVSFRDDESTHDENHLYRTALWHGMAAQSYADARELLWCLLDA